MMFLELFLFALLIKNSFLWELDDFVINQEIIDRINSDPSSPWKAGINEVFVGKRYRDIIPILANMKMDLQLEDSTSDYVNEISNDPPAKYDVYEKFPECKLPIRDMGQCGAVPRFSMVESMSDRICVHGGKKVVLSPQDPISCDKKDYACQGGYFSRTFEYLEISGVVTESCFPYTSGESGNVPKCPYKCVDGENWNTTKHKIKSWRKLKDDKDAMQDMLQYGSFIASWTGYDDFFSYKSGVYVHKWGALVGEPIGKVQGWGIDSSTGLEYWSLAFPWGNKFGMNGYVWIWKGHNECQFEDNMYSLIPDL